MHDGTLTVLLLCGSWAGHHGHSEFTDEAAMSRPENCISQHSSLSPALIVSLPLLKCSLGLKEGDTDVPFGAEHSTVAHLQLGCESLH